MTIKTLKVKKLLKGGKYTKKLVGGGKNETPSQEDLNTYLKYIIDNYDKLLKHQQNKKTKKHRKSINKFEELLNFYTPNKIVNKDLQFNIKIIIETGKKRINLFAKEYEPLRHAVALYHSMKKLNKSDNTKEDAKKILGWISILLMDNTYETALSFSSHIPPILKDKPISLQLINQLFKNKNTFDLVKSNLDTIKKGIILETQNSNLLQQDLSNSLRTASEAAVPEAAAPNATPEAAIESAEEGTASNATPEAALESAEEGTASTAAPTGIASGQGQINNYVKMTTPPSLYINIDTFYDNEGKPKFNIEDTYKNIQKKYKYFKNIYICTKKDKIPEPFNLFNNHTTIKKDLNKKLEIKGKNHTYLYYENENIYGNNAEQNNKHGDNGVIVSDKAEMVNIKTSGIVPDISEYVYETVSNNKHNRALRNPAYNLPNIAGQSRYNGYEAPKMRQQESSEYLDPNSNVLGPNNLYDDDKSIGVVYENINSSQVSVTVVINVDSLVKCEKRKLIRGGTCTEYKFKNDDIQGKIIDYLIKTNKDNKIKSIYLLASKEKKQIFAFKNNIIPNNKFKNITGPLQKNFNKLNLNKNDYYIYYYDSEKPHKQCTISKKPKVSGVKYGGICIGGNSQPKKINLFQPNTEPTEGSHYNHLNRNQQQTQPQLSVGNSGSHYNHLNRNQQQTQTQLSVDNSGSHYNHLNRNQQQTQTQLSVVNSGLHYNTPNQYDLSANITTPGQEKKTMGVYVMPNQHVPLSEIPKALEALKTALVKSKTGTLKRKRGSQRGQLHKDCQADGAKLQGYVDTLLNINSSILVAGVDYVVGCELVNNVLGLIEKIKNFINSLSKNKNYTKKKGQYKRQIEALENQIFDLKKINVSADDYAITLKNATDIQKQIININKVTPKVVGDIIEGLKKTFDLKTKSSGSNGTHNRTRKGRNKVNTSPSSLKKIIPPQGNTRRPYISQKPENTSLVTIKIENINFKNQKMYDDLYDLIIEILICLKHDDKENIFTMYTKLTELINHILNKTKINIHEYNKFFTEIRNKLNCYDTNSVNKFSRNKNNLYETAISLNKFCLDGHVVENFVSTNQHKKRPENVEKKEEFENYYKIYSAVLKMIKTYGYKASSSECKTRVQTDHIIRLLEQKSYIIILYFVAYWSMKYMESLNTDNTDNTSS